MTARPFSLKESSLQTWLQWQETLHPSVIDLGLDRIRAVASVLFGDGFASHQPTTITVAGTNGKGSCVTALAVLASCAGKRVGSFTSPHLFRYNERIRINNEEVSDADLCAAFETIDAARGDISLTYFEFNALAAFWLFRRYAVNLQILEVGLGGRLDAANLLDADIAVITNIALDHVDWLGDTREKIGAEKAGILRKNGKLVYGEVDMPASIRQQIDALDVELRQVTRQFSCSTGKDGFLWHGLNECGDNVSLMSRLPQLPLPSVACALQVLAWLGVWDASGFSQALSDIALAGRMQQIQAHSRDWILDVAHNEAGARFLADRLDQKKMVPVTAVFSAMGDKDLVGILSALKSHVKCWCFFPLPENPRAASLDQLRQAAMEAGIDHAAMLFLPDAAGAVDAAVAGQQAQTILVFGSFFTVAATHLLLVDHEK